MTLNSDDVKGFGVSLVLHILLMLIMVFWAAFPNISRLPEEIELTFVTPVRLPTPPPRLESRPRVQTTTTAQRSSSPRRSGTTSIEQSAARQAPSTESTARDRGAQRAAPSTPAAPRELRGTEDAVDFMDYGGGKQDRSTSMHTGDFTRQESREQGLSTSVQSSDNVSGAGTGDHSAITSDPGSLSATPHSSADIRWDGGVSRNRISGVLPDFPPGATREVQVAVRFRVRPDGSMYGMTVIQKGDPRYERAALAAMRTWKFNVLPESSKQADQVGTAVFSFKLK
ncbi:energy transducer TonB [bacterium]|nr:energy transducer TonB [bacterium]